MKKKKLFAALAILAVGLGIYFSGLFSPNELVLTGMVTTENILVSSEIGGRLEQVLAKEGDIVKKGTLLAMIQPREWKDDVDYFSNSEKQSASAVERGEAQLRLISTQAREQIEQAQANLASSEALVRQAQAELENAERELKRTRELFAQKVLSEEVFDQTRTTRDSAAARLESVQKQALAAKATLALSRATQEQVSAQQADLQSSRFAHQAASAQKAKAQTHLDYTQVIAPLDAVVDVRAALQGEVVNPGQPIFTLIDPENLWVRGDIEETYIDRIKLGDRLKVRLPSGRELEGTVFHRGVNADYATQRDVSRSKRDIKTFEIRLRCDNRDRILIAGMTAYVRVPLRP